MSTVYSKLSFSSDVPDGHIPGLRMQKNPRVKLPPTMRSRNAPIVEYKDSTSTNKNLGYEPLHEMDVEEFKAMEDQIAVSKYENIHAARAINALSHDKDAKIKPSIQLMMKDLDNDIIELDAKIHDVKNDLANVKIEGLNYHKDLIVELNDNMMRLEEETSLNVKNDVESVKANKQFLKQQRDDFVKYQQIQGEEIMHIQHDAKQKTKKLAANIGGETRGRIFALYDMQERIYLSFRDRLKRLVRLSFHADKKRMKKFNQLRNYIAECEQHLKILKQEENESNIDSMMNPLLESNERSTILESEQTQFSLDFASMKDSTILGLVEAIKEQDKNVQFINALLIGSPALQNSEGAPSEHLRVDGNPNEDTELKSQNPEHQESSTDEDDLSNPEHPPAVSSEAALKNTDDAPQEDKDLNDGSPDDNEEALPSNEEPEFIQQFATEETLIKWSDEDQIKDVPESEGNSAENDTGDETEKSGWLGRLHSNGKMSKKSKKKKKDKKEKVNKAKKDKKNNKGDVDVKSEESRESAEEKGDDSDTKSVKKSRKDKKSKSKKGSFFSNLFSCFGEKIPKEGELAVEDNIDKIEQSTCKPAVQPSTKDATQAPILTTQATTSAVQMPAKQAVKQPPKLVTTPKPPIASACRQRPEHKMKIAVKLPIKTVEILESMKSRTGGYSLEDGEQMNQWLSSPSKKASAQHQGIAYTAEQSKQMEKISVTGYSSYSAAEQMDSC